MGVSPFRCFSTKDQTIMVSKLTMSGSSLIGWKSRVSTHSAILKASEQTCNRLYAHKISPVSYLPDPIQRKAYRWKKTAFFWWCFIPMQIEIILAGTDNPAKVSNTTWQTVSRKYPTWFRTMTRIPHSIRSPVLRHPNPDESNDIRDDRGLS